MNRFSTWPSLGLLLAACVACGPPPFGGDAGQPLDGGKGNSTTD